MAKLKGKTSRQKILTWFRQRVGELRSQGLPEKQIKRKLLAAIRSVTKYVFILVIVLIGVVVVVVVVVDGGVVGQEETAYGHQVGQSFFILLVVVAVVDNGGVVD